MENEILKLQRSNDIQALQSFVENLDNDLICSEIRKSCVSGNGAVVLQILFRGLNSSSSCQEKRIRVTKAVLECIEKKLMSLRLAEKLLSVLGTQIKSFTTSDVTSLIDSCLQMMKETRGNDGCYCWKYLIPKLLDKIEEEDYIYHNGSAKSGSEYKSEIVIAIYIYEWPNIILTSIASMFIDITLTPDEHLRIVKKLCSKIPSINLEEIPPLIHQMLQLTRERNFIPLFLALAEFFEKNLYSKLSNKENLLSGSSFEAVQAVEATVLYHIYSVISCLGPQSVKDFIRILKETVNVPSFVLSPFFITFSLTISCVSYIFEEELLNLLRSAILRNYADDEKIKESAWIETIVPSPVSIEELFDKIILNCSRERDRILKGLVNLGFVLLSTPKVRGREMQCEKTWILGNSILVNLINQYTVVTCSILQTLADHISQIDESNKYTDCLFHIVKKNPLNVLDCSAVLIQLLDSLCTRLPGNVGKRIVTVILPLTKMSQSLRDNLIIILRKSLFPLDGDCREMAVTGITELLKNLKISNLRNKSQLISESYSGLSQIYSESCIGSGPSYSSEGLCLELLSILRVVFKYQHAVKTIFYRGIYESVCINREIGFHVLDNLQNQFHKFLKTGNELPPLNFDETVTIQDKNPVLLEPIAHLVFAMGLIVAKMEEGTTCSKLREMFDSLCQRMSDSDIPHFVLGKEFFDGGPESCAKEEEIRQILGVYEALMGYVLSTWTKDSSIHGDMLNSLFRAYSRLADYARSLGKPDKKRSEEKTKTAKSTESDEKRKHKNKIFIFRFPTTVFNFKCAWRLLSILHEDSVAWASEQSRAIVKNKREIHRYSLNVILALVKEALTVSGIELWENSNTLEYLTKIGRIIYIRCVKQARDMKAFDLQATVTSLECFFELLHLILSHIPEKFPKYLTDIYTGESKSGGVLSIILESIISEILEDIQSDIDAVEEEEEAASAKEEETLNQKLLLHLIAIATCLATQLPRGVEAHNVLNKVKYICKEKKVSNSHVARSILTLLLKLYFKCKPSGSLLLDLTLSLCEKMDLIDDEISVENHTAYAVINEQTANECILSVCDSLRDLVNEIEWTVTRLKSELLILSVSSNNITNSMRDELEEKERELCRHINFCMKVLSALSIIAIPPGKYANSVLREIGNFYHKVTIVTKYFILKIGKYKQQIQNSKFDKTVKMIDHELSKNMYCFTEYVIADGSTIAQYNSEKQSKKDPTFLKNTCLRKTKFIPKVIYEKEQFQKFVLHLSNKAKIDLAGKTRHALARDYRLHAKQIKEILAKENNKSEEMEIDIMELEESSTGKVNPEMED